MKAPEFTGYWFDDEDERPHALAIGEEDAADDARALDELAERVNAARSVL